MAKKIYAPKEAEIELRKRGFSFKTIEEYEGLFIITDSDGDKKLFTKDLSDVPYLYQKDLFEELMKKAKKITLSPSLTHRLVEWFNSKEDVKNALTRYPSKKRLEINDSFMAKLFAEIGKEKILLLLKETLLQNKINLEEEELNFLNYLVWNRKEIFSFEEAKQRIPRDDDEEVEKVLKSLINKGLIHFPGFNKIGDVYCLFLIE